MTISDAQFRLRIPVELHAKLVDNAEKNHRSINAEVVQRIVASFEWDTYSPTQMTAEINQLKQQFGSLDVRLAVLQNMLSQREFQEAEKRRVQSEEIQEKFAKAGDDNATKRRSSAKK